MMTATTKLVYFSVLLMTHVLCRAAAPQSRLPEIHPEGDEEEDTTVTYSKNIHQKILSPSSPPSLQEKITPSTSLAIETVGTENPRFLSQAPAKAQTSSRSKLRSKSKPRSKYDTKKLRVSLQRLVKQLLTRGRTAAAPAVRTAGTPTLAPPSTTAPRNNSNGCVKGKDLVCASELSRLESKNKTWDKERKIATEAQDALLTDAKYEFTGRPLRGKLKSEKSHASYFSNNLDAEVLEKKRTIPKMLSDIYADENLDTSETPSVVKAPSLKARGVSNSTSSLGQEMRTLQTGKFLKTETLPNSFERRYLGNVTNPDRLVENVKFLIPLERKISSRQSFVRRADPIGSGNISRKRLRARNNYNQQPDIKESHEGASNQSLFDEIQSENENYDDIHISEQRPTAGNYIVAFDDEEVGEGSVPSNTKQQDARQGDDVLIEDSADILVPDGDIADSEALREVQYSKHSIEAMRARLLAIMELHRRLCEQAALDDPPDWQGCGRAWDQVLCWPPSPPASLSTLPCPSHVPGMDAREGAATRWCDASGAWEEGAHTEKPLSSTTVSPTPEPEEHLKNTRSTDFPGFKSTSYGVKSTTSNSSLGIPSPSSPTHVLVTTVTPEDGPFASSTLSAPVTSSQQNIPASFSEGWTNYTRCLAKPRKPARKVSPLIAQWLPIVRSISVVGYSISLSALVVSCAILASFKRLRCARNLLHLHLFVSFSLRALAVLLKTPLLSPATVVAASTYDLDEEASSSAWVCRLTVAVWEYFIIANYSWLLMEGLYLHNLIFRALFTDSSAVLPYVLLGWGLPLVVIVCWSVARILVDNSHCWLVHFSPWPHWFGLRLPVAISVFLNLFFFLNIVRVLALKLRSSVSNNNGKFKKLGRSTMVLVPLFGVHYCLLWGLSLSSHPPVELAWLLLDQVCSSFQGMTVSVLYCFMNGEVRQELRKVYGRARREDEFGPLGTSYSTIMSRAKASMASLPGSSDRTFHSTFQGSGPPTPPPGTAPHTPPPRAAPHTPPRLVKKKSEDYISLHSVPEESLEMQPYPSSEPKSRCFQRLVSAPPCLQNSETSEGEMDPQSVSGSDQLRSDSTAFGEERLEDKYKKVSTTSFMPTPIIHTDKISIVKFPRRASLDRGIIASKNSAGRQKPPLVKKLSFQEPVKGLPFLGEILIPEKASKGNLSSSTTSGINSHLEDVSELSSLLPEYNSTSLTTVNDHSIVVNKDQTKSTKIQSVSMKNKHLNTVKCNGVSKSNRFKKLINRRGKTPYSFSS